MPTDTADSEKKKEQKLSEDQISAQLECFEKGTQYVQLLRPATANGGIFTVRGEEKQRAIKRFENATGNLSMTKFVPASGAATRMFKKLYSWIDEPQTHRESIESFFDKVEQFAFFDEWMRLADKADLETFQTGLNAQVAWLRLLVSSKGLDFAKRPKGLIPFHQYEQPALPIEEHMKEAMAYAKKDGKASIHFTVSEEHLSDFRAAVEKVSKQPIFADTEWDITFSTQDPTTDTIAVDAENNPVKTDGSYLTRPGGHGALIHNLNAIDSEIVFVKNIDNVCHDRLLNITIDSKRVLAGKLLELRDDFKVIDKELEKGLLDENSIMELREKWGLRVPKNFQKLKDYLERPIRVCGMVKNEGEPGGGPFYTTDQFTGESLQIIEQAQIDPNHSRQQTILRSSTHFNPVDLVCCLKNLKGEKIDLTKYVNEELYFIAQKSVNGKEIKALEWPGLWNGAMANWVTIFVEVPIATFNPVKEITDLLRSTHLSS